MSVFDYEWELLGWDRKDGEGAFGTVRTPSGDELSIHIGLKIHSEWTWLTGTIEEERIPGNQGDGTKGRYIRTRLKKGNLEVRLPPRFEDFRDGNFEKDYGFDLQPGLVPHVGDRINFFGIDSGELYIKSTAMIPLDYPFLTIDEFGAFPYAGLEVLSSEIDPHKLSLIWPQIQASPKSINVVKVDLDSASLPSSGAHLRNSA